MLRVCDARQDGAHVDLLVRVCVVAYHGNAIGVPDPALPAVYVQPSSRNASALPGPRHRLYAAHRRVVVQRLCSAQLAAVQCHRQGPQQS